MKKVLFTIQMIALVAMFPVYLVTELNRSNSVAVPAVNTPSKYTGMPEENYNNPALIPEHGLSTSVITMNTYYLNQ